METLGKKKLFLLGVLVVSSCYFSLIREDGVFGHVVFATYKKLWGLI